MRLSLLNWNIKCGTDRGPLSNGWARRKLALKAALAGERFDILNVQEALQNQLEFIQDCLPHFRRCGVGRTDGAAAGEHCAIFFDRRCFRLEDSGTFWLSLTPEKPSRSFDPPPFPPRVCSWVVLIERHNGTAFRVFNTHFPLSGTARKKSASVLIDQVKRIHPEKPMVLSGDFNSRPGSIPRKTIEASGLRNAGRARSWHIAGRGLVDLDAIYSSSEWTILNHKILRSKINGVHPSDHFGLSAELELTATN